MEAPEYGGGDSTQVRNRVWFQVGPDVKVLVSVYDLRNWMSSELRSDINQGEWNWAYALAPVVEEEVWQSFLSRFVPNRIFGALTPRPLRRRGGGRRRRRAFEAKMTRMTAELAEQTKESVRLDKLMRRT